MNNILIEGLDNLILKYSSSYITEDAQEPKILYHRSKAIIHDFNTELSKEIGLHCGTREQADSKIDNKYLYQIELNNIGLAHITEDVEGSYGSIEFLNILIDSNIIDSLDYNNLLSKLRSKSDSKDKELEYSKIYRDFLLKKGFYGFTYPNRIEGEGISYCLISEKAIRSIRLVPEIIKELAEEEKGVKFEIVDISFNNVTLKATKPITVGFYNKKLTLNISKTDHYKNIFVFDYSRFR